MRRRYEITDRERKSFRCFCRHSENHKEADHLKDRRQMLNAVLRVARTGAPWRDLPDYYGPWSSSYSFLWRLQKAGIWDENPEPLYH
ncbi:transposase [Paenibacillus sp. CN-4]|uniref:transposase n=1 Tax=Paenibacillus nanchangensis TaxID=3348343 RepID=UPI00397DA48A